MLPGPGRRSSGAAGSAGRPPLSYSSRPALSWCQPSRARLVTFLTGLLCGAALCLAAAPLVLGYSATGGVHLGGPASRGAPRYLVASSSSCEDIVPPKPWLLRPAGYDVVVFDYSANHTCKRYIRPGAGITLLHRPRTFKWPAMQRFFTEEETRGALAAYDAFLLTDDDVDIEGDAAGIMRLFRLCEATELAICQPSLSARSSVNMDVTAHTAHSDPDVVGRATRFVEQMSPLFTREALQMMLPFFRTQTHAWGIDTLWSDLAHRVDRRVGVIDAVQIDHMRPSGVSGLYKRVGGLEKAQADQLAFRNKYGVRPEFFAMVEKGHYGEGEPLRLREFVGSGG